MLKFIAYEREYLKTGEYPIHPDLQKLCDLLPNRPITLSLISKNEWFTVQEQEQYHASGLQGNMGWLGPKCSKCHPQHADNVYPGHEYVTVSFEVQLSAEDFSKFKLVKTHLGKQISQINGNTITLSLLDIGPNLENLVR